MDNYEKKYKEALERARKFYNELAACRTKQKVAAIFPELAESEDERMMREFNDWLCEEIECRTNDLRDEKDRRTLNMLCYILTKVKDWLEKQKEQKPWRVGANAYFTPEQKPEGVYVDCTEHPEWYGMPSIEQKPAEWSEEDKKRISEIKFALYQLPSSRQDAKVKCFKFLDSLRTRVSVNSEKVSANWKPSKEQMLKDAVEGVAEELYNDGEIHCTVGVGTYFKPGDEVYVIKKEDEE